MWKESNVLCLSPTKTVTRSHFMTKFAAWYPAALIMLLRTGHQSWLLPKLLLALCAWQNFVKLRHCARHMPCDLNMESFPLLSAQCTQNASSQLLVEAQEGQRTKSIGVLERVVLDTWKFPSYPPTQRFMYTLIHRAVRRSRGFRRCVSSFFLRWCPQPIPSILTLILNVLKSQ